MVDFASAHLAPRAHLLATAILLTTVAAAAAGCAGSTERRALSSFDAVHAGRGSPGRDAPDSKDLPALDATATLSDFLAYAALKNRGLEAAFHRWRAAIEIIPGARALPDPVFNYAFFIRRVETRAGPQIQKFGIMQMLPWPGKLSARGEVAAAAAEVEHRRYEALKLELFYRVKAEYFEYFFLGRAIDIMRENIELLKYLEIVVRARYRVGTASHASIVRLQVELGKLEDRLRSLEDLRTPIQARLNAALDRPPGTPIPLPTSIPLEFAHFSDEEAFAWLTERSPELLIADAEIDRADERVRLARSGYFPDFALGVDFIHTGAAAMPELDESGKDPIVAMLGVRIPLWWGKYDADVKSARASKDAAGAARAEKENNLEAMLHDALYRMRDAERRVDLYRDTLLPKATESLRVTRIAFETDRASVLDLIDTERTLLDFDLALARATADHASSMARIEMLVGVEVPVAEAPTDASPPATLPSTDGTGTPTDDGPESAPADAE